MENQQIRCQNCETEFESNFQFCPHCGQKAKDELTLGVLFYYTISNYFSVNARFFKSFIPLLFRPGYLAKKFIEGKRLLYLHPAQLYLFVSVVFFFVFSFKVREYNKDLDSMLQKGFDYEFVNDSIFKQAIDTIEVTKFNTVLKDKNIETGMNDMQLKRFDSIVSSVKDEPDFGFDYDKVKLDSLIAINASEEEQLKAIGYDAETDTSWIAKEWAKQMLKFYKQKGGGIAQAFFDTIPISMFILLPIFALILKIFYWRRGQFAYHLVFSFYYFSFLFVIMSLIVGVNYFIEIPAWIEILAIIYMFLYLWLSIKHFYNKGYISSFIKSVVITGIYLVFTFFIALGLVASSIILY